VRVNLGLFQHDVNVIWDLAIHDLSIMDYVLPAKATAVSATGISHIPVNLKMLLTSLCSSTSPDRSRSCQLADAG